MKQKRFHGDAEIVAFPQEIWRFKISGSNQKSMTPRMLIITFVFEEKTMLRLQYKKQGLQECLWLPLFLKDLDDNNGRREMAQFEMVNISNDVWKKWASLRRTNPGDHNKLKRFTARTP